MVPLWLAASVAALASLLSRSWFTAALQLHDAAGGGPSECRTLMPGLDLAEHGLDLQAHGEGAG